MNLTDKMSGMRKGFNSAVKYGGNKVYDGLGDVATADINLKDIAKVGLTGLVLGNSLFNSGCGAVVGGYVGAKMAENNSGQVKRDEYSDGKLIVEYWKDFDGNGNIDSGEILGEVEGPINMDKYGLLVKLNSIGTRKMTFYALDSDGNRVGYTENSRGNGWATTVGNESTKNWIGGLNDASKERPGEYTIYVERAERAGYPTIFKKTIAIERDK